MSAAQQAAGQGLGMAHLGFQGKVLLQAVLVSCKLGIYLLQTFYCVGPRQCRNFSLQHKTQSPSVPGKAAAAAAAAAEAAAAAAEAAATQATAQGQTRAYIFTLVHFLDFAGLVGNIRDGMCFACTVLHDAIQGLLLNRARIATAIVTCQPHDKAVRATLNPKP